MQELIQHTSNLIEDVQKSLDLDDGRWEKKQDSLQKQILISSETDLPEKRLKIEIEKDR